MVKPTHFPAANPFQSGTPAPFSKPIRPTHINSHKIKKKFHRLHAPLHLCNSRVYAPPRIPSNLRSSSSQKINLRKQGKNIFVNGFHNVGAHTDSPCLKLKPTLKVVKGGFLEVGLQTYGGGLWHTWFDRDLTIARTLLIRESKDGSVSYSHRLVRIEELIMRIPTLAIHLDRGVNDGFKVDTQSHLVPVLATSIKLQPLVLVHQFDKLPSYFIFAGFVFVPLTQPFLHEYGEDWYNTSPRRLCERALRRIIKE